MRRTSPGMRDNGISGDQLKRVLSLIDNHSQAMTLQRDSFNNLMVRVQLLEKSQARTILDPLSKSANRQIEIPSGMSRNMSVTHDKVGDFTDASLGRALRSIEPRNNSLQRHGAQSVPRRGSNSFKNQPSPLNIKTHIVSDSDLGLYDLALPIQNVKKTQLRANLYGIKSQSQTPISSMETCAYPENNAAEIVLEKVRIKKKDKAQHDEKKAGTGSKTSPYSISMPPIKPFLKELQPIRSKQPSPPRPAFQQL